MPPIPPPSYVQNSVYMVLLHSRESHIKVCLDVPFQAPFQGEPYRPSFRHSYSVSGEPGGVLFRHAPFQGKPYYSSVINMSTCSISGTALYM